MKNNKFKQKKTIIDKIWNLFDKFYFSHLSMQEIANHLNIKKSLLYYYFEDKTSLIEEVIQENIDFIFLKFDIVFKRNISIQKKIELLSKIYLEEINNKNILNFAYIESKKIDKCIINTINSIHNKILSYFNQAIDEGIKQGKIKNINPQILSLALLGYLDKIKKTNINTSDNWLDFIYN